MVGVTFDFFFLFPRATKVQLLERRQTILDTMASKERKYIIIRRHFIFEDILEAYSSDPELPKHTINVEFQGEMGVDADGLTREMFALF